MNKTVLILVTHVINEAVISEYKKMKNTPYVDAFLAINNHECKIPYEHRLECHVFYGVKVDCFFFDEKLHEDMRLPYYPYNDDLENFGKVVVYNSDNHFYYFKKYLPDYEYYWRIENDVYCNGSSYFKFLSRFKNNQDDLIISKLRLERKNGLWFWSEKMEWIYDCVDIYGSLFPVVRLSNRALDFLYKKRLEYSVRYDIAKASKNRWPYCELFVPTELTNNGFSCSDLGEPYIFWNNIWYLNNKRFFEERDNHLYHPVKTFDKDLIVENANLLKKMSLDDSLIMEWLNMARIDIKNHGEGNDADIKVVKGENSNVIQPRWFSNAGVGYLLETHDKYLVLEIECKGSGELMIRLEGIDRRSPSGTRLPLWVDYTRLAVNKETIFWELKSQWHDSPYTYMRQVKDGEKLIVEISWSEHRYNREEIIELLKSWFS